MNQRWAFDNEVNQLYNNMLQRHQNADVYWTTGMSGTATSLSDDDLDLLIYILATSGKNCIFIPKNTGNHWYPIVLHKDSDGIWRVDQIHTIANGDCGRDMVAQSERITQQGFEAYAHANPTKIGHATQEIRRIQNILAVNSGQAHLTRQKSAISSSEYAQASGPQFQKAVESQAIIENRLIKSLVSASKKIDPVSYELFKLAEYEMTNNSKGIQETKEKLIDLIKRMNPEAQQHQITKLIDSNLGNKQSIQAIISRVVDSKPLISKTSANPHSLLVGSKVKPQLQERSHSVPVMSH